MRFGPMTEFDLNKLKDLLDFAGAEYHVDVSKDELDLQNSRRASTGPTPYPTYDGPDRFVYLEIKTAGLLVIRKELENMGLLVNSKSDELDAPTEYFCLKCKYTSAEKGFCPKHKGPLLEFSDWVAKKAEPSRLLKFIYFAIVILFLGGIIYSSFSVPSFAFLK